ncbi:ABC transporter permease [Thermobifida cellulosilytica]|uniref:Transport permease protein n=1 Tax=Thermobifida cellulosilytica TB100 TaxID=665004 RepID=A0A147KJ48_THECS|nr:ABC transporter permease [Thermobifida cellulosilytica]KUP97271.1 multidrug ABC transporter permease [Thermobifida cellulosilytica TB100]
MSAPTSPITDTVTVFVRELRPVLRDPFSVVFSLVQPLIFLALFAPLLPGGLGGESTLQWFVPGIVVMSCLFATLSTGANLLFEIQLGSHERMLVSPLRRSALIVGRALKEIVPILVQTAIILLVTLPFGFRPHPLGALYGLLVLSVFSVGVGSLSYALALVSKDRHWLFWGVQQTLMFPLVLLAGIMLPVSGGPGWLQTLSLFNPLTYVVDAQRALFNGDLADPSVVWGTLASAAVAVVGLWVGIATMRRAD